MRAAGIFQWSLVVLWLRIVSDLVVGVPINTTLDDIYDDDFQTSNNLLPRQEKWPLRIMPLGASITAGHASTPEDGYRKKLRTLLRYTGHPVNMVGSQ